MKTSKPMKLAATGPCECFFNEGRQICLLLKLSFHMKKHQVEIHCRMWRSLQVHRKQCLICDQDIIQQALWSDKLTLTCSLTLNLFENVAPSLMHLITWYHFVSLLQECKQACREESGCKGIEHSDGRCELWTRAQGIQATVPLSGFKRLRWDDLGMNENHSKKQFDAICSTWKIPWVSGIICFWEIVSIYQ